MSRKLSRILGRRRARYLALGGLLGATGVGGTGKTREFNFNPVAAAVATEVEERGTEDEVATYRAGFQSADWDLPNLQHERVDYWVDRFQNVPEMREKMGNERAVNETSYYEISQQLPEETRDYVPLMMAAARIVKDLEKHGFDHVVPDGPEVFDEVLADANVALEDLAAKGGMPVEALKDLNPHLVRGRTPKDTRYTVRVPVGSSTRLAEALGDL